MQEKSTNEKNLFSEWLEKLQQESWQLELLISGFAIYGLFYAKDAIEAMMFTLELAGNHRVLSMIPSVFLNITWVALNIFIINLIIHVIVRALWIGAIGLRYVSGDINYEKLNYSEAFTSYFRNKIGSFDDYIERLEKFSSVLFSFTFLIFLILISISIFIIELFCLISFFVEISPFVAEYIGSTDEKVFITFFFISLLTIGPIVLFILIDFFTFGLFKRIKDKGFTRVYLILYRFGSFVTLSFLWKPLLLNFIDQTYTRRLFLFAMPYALIVGVLIPKTTLSNMGHYPGLSTDWEERYNNLIEAETFHFKYYDDDRLKYSQSSGKKIYNYLGIPSKKVSGQLGEVFISNRNYDQYYIKQQDSTVFQLNKEGLINTIFSSKIYKPKTERDRAEEKKATLKALRKQYRKNKKEGKVKKGDWDHLLDSVQTEYSKNELEIYKENLNKTKEIIKSSIHISIDEQPIEHDRITCDYYRHPQGGEVGMLLFFPLDSLSLGRHLLQVNKTRVHRKLTKTDTIFHSIPFIYLGEN